MVDFVLTLPSFHSASGYYVSAYKSIKTKMLNIDILLLWESWWCLCAKYVWLSWITVLVFRQLNRLIFFMLLGKCSKSKPIVFWVSKGILNPIFHSNYQNQSDLSEESVAIYDVEKVIDSSEIKNSFRWCILISENAEIIVLLLEKRFLLNNLETKFCRRKTYR
jgi:Cu+-exporting ATPase